MTHLLGDWGLGQWLISSLMLGFVILLAIRFLHQAVSYTLENGSLVLTLGFWKRKFSLQDLLKVENDPTNGKVYLKFTSTHVNIPLRVQKLGIFMQELEQFHPTIKKESQGPFFLKSSRSPHIFYLVFLVFIIAFYFAVLPGTLNSWLGRILLDFSTLTLGLFTLWRILFLIPTQFILDSEGVRVNYLLRHKYFPAVAALSLVEDHYVADGTRYLVVKMIYNRRNLVLDEFNLHRPLEPLIPWIRSVYGPAVHSMF